MSKLFYIPAAALRWVRRPLDARSYEPARFPILVTPGGRCSAIAWLPEKSNGRALPSRAQCIEPAAHPLRIRCIGGAVRRAFSLIELMIVMGIISVMAGLSVPAVKGLTGSNNLNTGARKFADLLSLARSEAIARHAVVRFAVAKNWDSKTGASLRNVSLWIWDADLERYLPLGPWQELPLGVTIEAASPAYLQNAGYAKDDRAAVRGECVLAPAFQEKAEFNAGTKEEPIWSRFIEFLPSGTMRIPGGRARQAIFVATQGYLNPDRTLTYTTRGEDGPANWAQVNVDTLTGRVRVYRP